MPFDFDRVIDRRNTHSVKWDGMAARTGCTAPDGIAMWVADMDFAAPEPVLERLRATVDHGVFGYYGADESWRRAICGWMARRHGWAADPDWITFSPGVGTALSVCIAAYSAPGEGVVIFAPVYHVFAQLIRVAGRRVIESPLRETQGRYAMDLEALAASLPPDARMVLLCSPHNPGGTVWTAEELQALAAFCLERDLVLVSDEVHHDLVYPEARHTVTAVAAPEIGPKLVTLAAPSKTFNLAGLQAAQTIIAEPGLRAQYRRAAEFAHVLGGNVMGFAAAEAAYDLGEPWLEALIPYLAANRDRFAAGLAEAVPGARAMRLEATYLGWADFAGTGLDDEAVQRRIREGARIGVNAGPTFGTGGQARARFNLACPRSTIDTALGRLAEAFADLR